MNTDNMRPGTCGEVEDRMADILDGSAPDALLDHIAECDVCRDARYDAERARDLVAKDGELRPDGRPGESRAQRARSQDRSARAS